ncbi:MAG: amidophosphoribosyltransferase [Phototrophicales bacterium]|nr:MAG: amidophosphoribosyltransferase [Phototrophicales bacterium]
MSGIASVGIHKGKLRKAVQALKYDNERSLAQYPLGALLFTRLESLDWTIDTIIPVPLHTNRYRKRGYNQSQLLSEALAEYAMLPVITHALYRNRDTPPQVGLDSHERQRNVSGAFAANPYLVHQKNILLLDDVYTTGATMRACAEALTAAGAHQIYGLTVTVAEPN